MFPVLAMLMSLIPLSNRLSSLEACLRNFITRGVNPLTGFQGEFTDTPYALGAEVPFTYPILSLLEHGAGVGVLHGESLIIDGKFSASITFGLQVEVTEDCVELTWKGRRAILRGNHIQQIVHFDGSVEVNPLPVDGEWATIGVGRQGAKCWGIRTRNGLTEYGEGTMEPSELQWEGIDAPLLPNISRWYPYPS